MAHVTISTTIPLDLWNLAKEKHFKWNECLILGIRTMNGDRLGPHYEKMQQTIVKQGEVMEEIFDEVEDLKKRNQKLNKLMEKKDGQMHC